MAFFIEKCFGYRLPELAILISTTSGHQFLSQWMGYVGEMRQLMASFTTAPNLALYG